VVATGRFTDPAREYAKGLTDAGDPHPIDLIDGTDLREIADEIGLDLHNGRIEIVCDETLRPFDPPAVSTLRSERRSATSTTSTWRSCRRRAPGPSSSPS
jgi:restriction endonuclease Mrr